MALMQAYAIRAHLLTLLLDTRVYDAVRLKFQSL